MNEQQARRCIGELWPQIAPVIYQAYTESGRGVATIDLMNVPDGVGVPISVGYIEDPTTPELKDLVASYDPETQAVVLLRSDDGEAVSVWITASGSPLETLSKKEGGKA